VALRSDRSIVSDQWCEVTGSSLRTFKPYVFSSFIMIFYNKLFFNTFRENECEKYFQNQCCFESGWSLLCSVKRLCSRFLQYDCVFVSPCCLHCPLFFSILHSSLVHEGSRHFVQIQALFIPWINMSVLKTDVNRVQHGHQLHVITLCTVSANVS